MNGWMKVLAIAILWCGIAFACYTAKKDHTIASLICGGYLTLVIVCPPHSWKGQRWDRWQK